MGRISAVGSWYTSEAATVGRLVGIGWIRDACGTCRVCDGDIKDETRCLEQVFSGRDVPGTMARYTVVPERYITPLPDGVPSEMLAPIMCAGATAYKALKVANLPIGSWVWYFWRCRCSGIVGVIMQSRWAIDLSQSMEESGEDFFAWTQEQMSIGL